MPLPFPDSSPADAALLALRPTVDAVVATDAAGSVGDFLHQTLRPVLKLQNQRLLTVAADFLADHHVPFAGASAAERQQVVAELLTRNTKLRYTIVGLISGLFTSSETAFYRANRPELNRRLLELAVRRVQDQTAEIATLLPPG